MDTEDIAGELADIAKLLSEAEQVVNGGLEPGKLEDPWLTPAGVRQICPACSDKMETKGIKAIRASALGRALAVSEGRARVGQWDNLPKGWDQSSLKSFWKTIGGKVSKCMDKIGDHVTDPGAFCASLKDKMTGTTKWRGKKE